MYVLYSIHVLFHCIFLVVASLSRSAVDAACRPYLHQVVLRHRVRYPAHFVVGLEDVIMNLELLPAIVPVKKEEDKK